MDQMSNDVFNLKHNTINQAIYVFPQMIPVLIDITDGTNQQEDKWKELPEAIKAVMGTQTFWTTSFGKIFKENIEEMGSASQTEKMEMMMKRFKKMFIDKFKIDISKEFYCIKREPQYNLSNCIPNETSLLVYGSDFWPTRSIISQAAHFKIQLKAFKVDYSHTKLSFCTKEDLLQWLNHYEGVKLTQNNELQQHGEMEDETQAYKGWFKLRDYNYITHKRRRWARYCTNHEEDVQAMKKQTKLFIFQLIMKQAENSFIPEHNCRQPLNMRGRYDRQQRSQKQRMIQKHGVDNTDQSQPYKRKQHRDPSRSRQKKHKAISSQNRKDRKQKKQDDDLSSLDDLNQFMKHLDLSPDNNKLNQVSSINQGDLSILQTQKQQMQEGEISNLSILPKFSSNSPKKQKLKQPVLLKPHHYDDNCDFLQQHFPIVSMREKKTEKEREQQMQKRKKFRQKYQQTMQESMKQSINKKYSFQKRQQISNGKSSKKSRQSRKKQEQKKDRSKSKRKQSKSHKESRLKSKSKSKKVKNSKKFQSSRSSSSLSLRQDQSYSFISSSSRKSSFNQSSSFRQKQRSKDDKKKSVQKDKKQHIPSQVTHPPPHSRKQTQKSNKKFNYLEYIEYLEKQEEDEGKDKQMEPEK